MVDGSVFKSSDHGSGFHFTLTSAGSWTVRPSYSRLNDICSEPNLDVQRAKPKNLTHSSSRIQAILTSTMPIQIIIPHKGPTRERSAALRLAHTLNVYHKLDVDIVDSAEALKNIRDGTLTPGNVIAIGDTETPLIRHLLAEKRTPFQIDGTSLYVNGRPLTRAGLGTIVVHTAVCYSPLSGF